MKNLNNILENLIAKLDLSSVSLFLIAFLTTLFLLEIVLSIFLREHNRNKRTWFLFVVVGAFFLSKAISIYMEKSSVYPYLTLGVGLVQVGVIFSVRERRKKMRKEDKKLYKFIDDAKKYVQAEENLQRLGISLPSEEISFDFGEEPKKATAGEKEYGIDFSHLKNVIDKLDYYGLNSADKKQVKELDECVARARESGFSEELKGRINDGLSALIKIMSKYGV